MTRLIILAVAASSPIVLAQAPSPPQFANLQSQRAALCKQAKSALADETARETAGDCPNVSTTRGSEECLAAESSKTQANYATFTAAVRAMLVLQYRSVPGGKPDSGPTGTPLTSDELSAEFDRLEAESKRYRQDASKAAYDQFKGGTFAPVFALAAEQKLLRLHLHELAFIYGELLSNH